MSVFAPDEYQAILEKETEVPLDAVHIEGTHPKEIITTVKDNHLFYRAPALPNVDQLKEHMRAAFPHLHRQHPLFDVRYGLHLSMQEQTYAMLRLCERSNSVAASMQKILRNHENIPSTEDDWITFLRTHSANILFTLDDISTMHFQKYVEKNLPKPKGSRGS